MAENARKIAIDCGWGPIVLFIIAFWGEPDLVDALIHALMKGG